MNSNAAFCEDQDSSMALIIKKIESDRRLLSEVLHDKLNPPLIVCQMKLAELAHEASDPHLREELESVLAQLQKAYGVSRGIARGVRPEVIDHLGLKTALVDMVETMNDSSNSRKFTFQEKDDALANIDQNKSIGVYRIVQESCVNAVKHSHATVIDVRAEKISGKTKITIKDNGVGFSGNGLKGIGAILMQEYAASINAKLKTFSDYGAVVELTV